MKAWEVLKMLQEGKKMTRRKWGEGIYVYIEPNKFGEYEYCFLYDENNDIIDIGEVLCDSDDWEEYIR